MRNVFSDDQGHEAGQAQFVVLEEVEADFGEFRSKQTKDKLTTPFDFCCFPLNWKDPCSFTFS